MRALRRDEDRSAAIGAPLVDVTPPTLTNTRAVSLAITATGAGGLATMCVTNTTAACTPFETFATTEAKPPTLVS